MSELELIGGVVFKRNSCGQPLSTPQLFERYAALRARVAELEAIEAWARKAAPWVYGMISYGGRPFAETALAIGLLEPEEGSDESSSS